MLKHEDAGEDGRERQLVLEHEGAKMDGREWQLVLEHEGAKEDGREWQLVLEHEGVGEDGREWQLLLEHEPTLACGGQNLLRPPTPARVRVRVTCLWWPESPPPTNPRTRSLRECPPR